MKKLISILLTVIIMITVLTMQVNASSPIANDDYVEEFKAYLLQRGYGPRFEEEIWYFYGEYYQYFSDDNNTQTPDWLLAYGGGNTVEPMYSFGIFGDYYIQNYNIYSPFSLIYCIYVPEENKFYSLEYAYDMQFEGIENVFTECLVPKGKAGVIGDADLDSELSIVDATFIQLELAGVENKADTSIGGLCVYGEKISDITDFDRDGEVSILDATAIQMKLAGLE